MNRFANQCYERCFCDFCNSSFLIRGSVTVHWPPVSILKSGMKHLRRDKSYQFQPPKFTQKEVSVFELSKSKSTGQREVGCWCFPKLASYTRKKIILFTLSIARYLVARRRTHVNAQVINIYFYRSHRVPSSLSNSWRHIAERKNAN